MADAVLEDKVRHAHPIGNMELTGLPPASRTHG